jgi:hypothetical protein
MTDEEALTFLGEAVEKANLGYMVEGADRELADAKTELDQAALAHVRAALEKATDDDMKPEYDFSKGRRGAVVKDGKIVRPSKEKLADKVMQRRAEAGAYLRSGGKK